MKNLQKIDSSSIQIFSVYQWMKTYTVSINSHYLCDKLNLNIFNSSIDASLHNIQKFLSLIEKTSSFKIFNLSNNEEKKTTQ